RRARQARACRHHGHRPPRDPRAGAAGDPDDPVRRLSQADPRHVGGLGDATARELQSGAHHRESGGIGGGAMNVALLPALPEIVLAVGAMALLMVGAYGGEGVTRLVNGASFVLLAAAAVIVCLLP